MTKKDELRANIRASFGHPEGREGKDLAAEALITKFLDGISEAQADALLSLDNFINTYTDGQQSPPVRIGALIYLALCMTETEAGGTIQETAQGFADRSMDTTGPSFWDEVVEILADAKNGQALNLDRLAGVRPNTYVSPNSKLANLVSEIMARSRDKKNTDLVPVRVSSPAAKKDIVVRCLISGDDLQGKISPYDMVVYSAICSLSEQGETVMTPATIYRAMTGEKTGATPSRGQTAAVTRSVNKMRTATIYIDCTDEVEAYARSRDAGQYDALQVQRKAGGPPRFFFDTYLLAAEWFVAQAGRDQVRALRILRRPVLLEHAKISKQVISVPAYLLDTKHLIKNSEMRIVLKDYLLRRIEGMKGKNNLTQRTISLLSREKGSEHRPGLYEIATGKAEPGKKDAANVRQAAQKYLDYWKERGYISGFSFVKTGDGFSSIKIDL